MMPSRTAPYLPLEFNFNRVRHPRRLSRARSRSLSERPKSGESPRATVYLVLLPRLRRHEIPDSKGKGAGMSIDRANFTAWLADRPAFPTELRCRCPLVRDGGRKSARGTFRPIVTVQHHVSNWG